METVARRAAYKPSLKSGTPPSVNRCEIPSECVIDGLKERDKRIRAPLHERPRLREPPLRRAPSLRHEPSLRHKMRILCVIILKAPSARPSVAALVAEGGEAESVGTASERSSWRAIGWRGDRVRGFLHGTLFRRKTVRLKMRIYRVIILIPPSGDSPVAARDMGGGEAGRIEMTFG